MHLILGILILATTLQAGGADAESSISTVAPKFEGQIYSELWEFFGHPMRSSQSENILLQEWRIGFYTGEPDLSDLNVRQKGNPDWFDNWGTQFFGCIIQATINNEHLIANITLRDSPETVESSPNELGCGQALLK